MFRKTQQLFARRTRLCFWRL